MPWWSNNYDVQGLYFAGLLLASFGYGWQSLIILSGFGLGMLSLEDSATLFTWFAIYAVIRWWMYDRN